MNNSKRFTAVATVTCVLTFGALAACATIGANRHDDGTTTVQYVGVELPESVARDIAAHGGINACPTEDGDNCYWNAIQQGVNRDGFSFVMWQGKLYSNPVK